MPRVVDHEVPAALERPDAVLARIPEIARCAVLLIDTEFRCEPAQGQTGWGFEDDLPPASPRRTALAFLHHMHRRRNGWQRITGGGGELIIEREKVADSQAIQGSSDHHQNCDG